MIRAILLPLLAILILSQPIENEKNKIINHNEPLGPDERVAIHPSQTRLAPSQDIIEYLAQIETGVPADKRNKLKQKFLSGYYGDGSGHKTYGYGLLYHPLKRKYMDEVKPEYTADELYDLFVVSVYKRFNIVVDWMNYNNITLTQNQLDALTSLVYNCGSKILKQELGTLIIKDMYNPTIYSIWTQTSNKQFKKWPGLKIRRQHEATLFFS